MGLSKSRIISSLQCHKKLWLEMHRPDLIEASPAIDALFASGHQVGAIAQMLYGRGEGEVIAYDPGLRDAVARTRALMAQPATTPIFEATYTFDDVLVRVDALLRANDVNRIVEVKAGASVKDVYLSDCAIQAWLFRAAGHTLDGISVAHVDTSFIYPGGGDYAGLLKEADVTETIRPLLEQVPRWVAEAKQVLEGPEPDIAIGPHCHRPYACPFHAYCAPPSPDYPIAGLKGSRKVIAELVAEGYEDIRDVPDGRLASATQLRIWRATCNRKALVDEAAVEFARALGYPRYYLDFETVGLAVPIWAGTRPYEKLPFQWSCHIEDADGALRQAGFLDLSGGPPMRACAETLIEHLGEAGPILVYTSFEQGVIDGLAARFPDLAVPLLSLIDRLVDLYPLMRAYYYHPDMLGSWSLKAVLPTVAPDMDYTALDEVQDGMAAGRAYLEAIQPDTDVARRAEIDARLRTYCCYDTLAMVRLVRYFTAAQP
ncbi:DUF2779 domain-containing protein [soil metagenome]